MDTTSDRLGFTVFVAVVLHAALILGVGFQKELRGPRARSLEITLARFKHDETVQDADFLAQINQQGSGSDALPADLSSPVASQVNAIDVQAAVQAATSEAPVQAVDQQDLVTASQASAMLVIDSEHMPRAEPTAARPGALQTQSDLASLMAKLDEQQIAYARRPRVHRLTSVATRESADAQYLLNWKSRIETIGNQNYPLEARRKRMYGDLRLLVAVNADGTVADIRVLQSSGERLLDDAARRIVRLAEPFAPFPAVMSARSDVVEIIRTWQFRGEGLRASN